MSEEHEEGEVVEEDKDTAGHAVDRCIDLRNAAESEEYEERRVFYHSSSGYYYDPVSVLTKHVLVQVLMHSCSTVVATPLMRTVAFICIALFGATLQSLVGLCWDRHRSPC